MRGGIWWYRLAALAVLLVQLALVHSAYPGEERWFLHSDDHEAYLLARQVAQTGLPRVPYDGSEWSLYPVDTEVDARIVGGYHVSIRPPALFYALAPAAAISPEATFVWMELLSLGAAFVLYLLAERMFGGLGGLVSLAVFAFSAPVLFWGPFLMSNLPAVGVLLGGVLLLLSSRGWVKGLGVATLAISILWRFEYLLVLGILGVTWISFHARHYFRARAELLPLLIGGVVGLLVVAGLSYTLYETVDVVAVTRGGNEGNSTFEKSTAGFSLERAEANYRSFLLPLLLVPAVLSPFILLARRDMQWVSIGLFLAALAVALYFLGSIFLPQRFLLSHAYTRYLLPVAAVGALGAGGLAAALLDRVRHRVVLPVVLALCVLHASAGSTVAFGPDGFGTASAYTRDALNHTASVDDLPPGSIIVGDWARKTFIDKDVFAPLPIPEPIRQNETVRVVRLFLEEGRQVYLAGPGDPNHYAYDRGKYGSWFTSQPDMSIRAASVPGFYEIVLLEAGP